MNRTALFLCLLLFPIFAFSKSDGDREYFLNNFA